MKLLNLTFLILLFSFDASALAAPAKKATKSKTLDTQSVDTRFNQIRKLYRQGEMTDAAMWNELANISYKLNQVAPERRGLVLQSQAHLLMKNDHQITAAVFAAQALKQGKDPTVKEYDRSWEILEEVSNNQPIQNLLELLTNELKLADKTVPRFGTNWHYFVGNALGRSGQLDEAIAEFAKIKTTDRYYMSGRFQTAMIQIDRNKLDEAKVVLKSILNNTVQELSPLEKKDKAELTNYTFMALGRISYEQRKFQDSVRFYRSVGRDSEQFYNALFEQSWAFFMAGYPNHALGAIHGVQSPFFKDAFNPEATMLNAMIYYWMCRYDDSRTEVANFMDKHSDAVEQLTGFLDRKQMTEEVAYTLFENLITGVSENSLGIPKNILKQAAERDNMTLVRSQFAAVLKERQDLSARGVFKSKKNIAVPLDYLDRWSSALRVDIGKKFLVELKALKTDYERLYQQAQFLYVELLMSEKDQLLGKELHGNTKISEVTSKNNIKGWGKKTQSWGNSDKDEFWWDEVGFYIYELTPMCQAH